MYRDVLRCGEAVDNGSEVCFSSRAFQICLKKLSVACDQYVWYSHFTRYDRSFRSSRWTGHLKILKVFGKRWSRYAVSKSVGF